MPGISEGYDLLLHHCDRARGQLSHTVPQATAPTLAMILSLGQGLEGLALGDPESGKLDVWCAGSLRGRGCSVHAP